MILPYSTQSIDNDDIGAVVATLKSSHLTQGARVEAFESALCSYTGAKFALVFNSATSALYAAYAAALDMMDTQNAKDSTNCAKIYAITSPISFVATANMMLLNAITPVFAEVLPDGNINPKSVEQILETHPKRSEIKMLVSVDYAGKSAEVGALKSLAKKHNLAFISDSSHSLGGSYNGAKIGTLADATIFSFHAVKPITTAEGGALVTNNEQIYSAAKLIRSHGVVKKSLWNSDVVRAGFNFRMSDVAAALGLSQLKKLDSFIAHRENLARIYDAAFGTVGADSAKADSTANTIYSGIGADSKNCTRAFHALGIPAHITSSRHLYPIFLSPSLWCAKEGIFARLQERGLGVQVHYKPINEFSLYRQQFGDQLIESARNFYLAELSIPLHQKMSEADAAKIIEILNAEIR